MFDYSKDSRFRNQYVELTRIINEIGNILEEKRKEYNKYEELSYKGELGWTMDIWEKECPKYKLELEFMEGYYSELLTRIFRNKKFLSDYECVSLEMSGENDYEYALRYRLIGGYYEDEES